MSTTIEMTLDEASIAKAIKQLEQYKAEVIRKVEMLAQLLVDRGVDIVQAQIMEMDAIDTAELYRSIQGYYSPLLGAGIIFSDIQYAFYVEYGTGVRGAARPHPTGGSYDINNHGDDGWWYLDSHDNEWHWTKGWESRPFMYNTIRQLERECAAIAGKVFK